LEDFGIGDLRLDLLEAFYDNAADLIEELESTGVVSFAPLDYPDYNTQLAENTTPLGRSLKIRYPSTWRKGVDSWGGNWLVESLLGAAEQSGTIVRTGHQVHRVVQNDAGEVIGVEVRVGTRNKLVGARRGVVFASGGFLHNVSYREEFLRGPVFGGAASRSSTGDLVPMAAALGAQLGNMSHAWWDQVVLELTYRLTETIDDVYSPFGDSMIIVNRFGRRVVNEKAPYNERGQAHFEWDSHRLEYPNRVLFMIFDDDVLRSTAKSPFRWPVPLAGERPDYLISGDNWDELALRINEHLVAMDSFVGGVRLDTTFVKTLQATIAQFNDAAHSGVDPDFARGSTMLEQRWAGDARDGMPNSALHPMSKTGPYHCILLGGGALDTKGGPITDSQARFLNFDGAVIPGVYGAGNCISSPAGQAYWGAGGTIGLALTFGAIAGRHAAGQSDRAPL
jgi:succinate dehydrogenase/fumarate reductase flavoprotein subunit